MRAFLLHNIPIKILSLLIAIGLWWYIALEHSQRFQSSLSVKVQYVNLPATYSLIAPPKVVPIEVMGHSLDVMNITPDSFSATADLKNLSAGKHKVRLKLTSPPNVRIVNQAIFMPLEIVRHTFKLMNVKINVYGDIPIGLTVGEMKITPRKVKVFGDYRFLKSVFFVAGDLDLTGKQQNYGVKVLLYPFSKEGRKLTNLTLVPDKVKVELEVRKENATKIVPIVPKFASYSILPDRFKQAYMEHSVVTISGDDSVLNKIDFIETEMFDFNKCVDKPYVMLDLRLPPFVFSNLQKIKISCAKKIRDIVTKRLEGIPVLDDNLSNNLSVQIIPLTTTVTAHGTKESLAKISRNDITAKIDLAGLGVGTYKLKPTPVLYKDGINVDLEITEYVEVSIKKRY